MYRISSKDILLYNHLMYYIYIYIKNRMCGESSREQQTAGEPFQWDLKAEDEGRD